MIHDRWLRLNGALNVRDLGGYSNVEGRQTRWGRLLRSDALHAVTSDDLVTLGALGIVTVIDLRTQSEIAYTGRGAFDRSSITLIETDLAPVHVVAPLSSTSMNETALHELYLRYLVSGSANFVRALGQLALPETYPAIVSCFFGKDRTGVLIALVLACLGIEHDAIIYDYALSASRMSDIVDRLRTNPVYDETLDRTPAWRLAAPLSAMATFLARLDEDYGGARSWALHAGLSPTQLENLSTALLE